MFSHLISDVSIYAGASTRDFKRLDAVFLAVFFQLRRSSTTLKHINISFFCVILACGDVQVGGIVAQAISRMGSGVATRKEQEALRKLEVEAKLAEGVASAFQSPKALLEGLRSRK